MEYVVTGTKSVHVGTGEGFFAKGAQGARRYQKDSGWQGKQGCLNAGMGLAELAKFRKHLSSEVHPPLPEHHSEKPTSIQCP
jgi:hypothetical protein